MNEQEARASHNWTPTVAWADGCVAFAAAFALVVTAGQAAAPAARAEVTAVPDYATEPTLPRTFGPLRPIFAVTATPTRNVDSGTTAREVPRIATSAPRSAETPVPSLPGTPQATTQAPAASEPVATTATTTTTTPTATTTPAATTAPPTTTPPAPTTEPPTVTETPEITLPTETTATETTEATP